MLANLFLFPQFLDDRRERVVDKDLRAVGVVRADREVGKIPAPPKHGRWQIFPDRLDLTVIDPIVEPALRLLPALKLATTADVLAWQKHRLEVELRPLRQTLVRELRRQLVNLNLLPETAPSAAPRYYRRLLVKPPSDLSAARSSADFSNLRRNKLEWIAMLGKDLPLFKRHPLPGLWRPCTS